LDIAQSYNFCEIPAKSSIYLISRNIQIISITHLPQVAAKGEFHFKIYKENRNNKTNTLLIDLKNEERVEELAKMLSGEKLTAAARENARTLLNS